MRWLLGAMLISCAPTRYVFVPKTDEGGKCWRECKATEAVCRNGPESQAFMMGVGDSRKKRCADDCDQCLLTCPGAEWREKVD